jgi:hypothetical protein
MCGANCLVSRIDGGEASPLVPKTDRPISNSASKNKVLAFRATWLQQTIQPTRGIYEMHEPIDFELLLTAVQRCFECKDVCTSECRYFTSKTFLDNNCVSGVHGMELYADSFPRGESNG